MDEKYQFIKNECLLSGEKDPLKLLVSIMKKPFISMHGPEHHILDGACFLTALYNAGAEFDLSAALDEMIQRGCKIPGAICGHWGICGSAASVGAALSIFRQTGPLSDNSYYQDHLAFTSLALSRIGEAGGPRCCKRNAFLTLSAAVSFVNEHYGIGLPQSSVVCGFSPQNRQCIGSKCPFFPG